MNKVYLVVWNASLGIWSAVSELGKGRKKSSSSAKVLALATTMLVGSSVFAMEITEELDPNIPDLVDSSELSHDSDAIITIANAEFLPTSVQGFSVGTPRLGVGSYEVGGGAASGGYSTALGYLATASEETTTALGTFTTASGFAATALGSYSTASGSGATALGSYANASEKNTTAVGHFAFASAENATAVGAGAAASGISSTALGESAAASYYATAVGHEAIASEEYSTALGEGALASGISSTALGRSSSAASDYATAVGSSSAASGISSTALGYGAAASGISSTALGRSSSASKVSSTAVGTNAKALGIGSTAVGSGATALDYATAVGAGAAASGVSSTAFGNGAIASSTQSVALGTNANASGTQSIALGNATAASDYATALGINASATGVSSTAIGNNSDAQLSDSIALGSNSVVSADKPAVNISSATVGALNFNGFSGNVADAGHQVSIGGTIKDPSTGKMVTTYRQLKNLAAGEISSTSTDGINGSQLYSTNAILSDLATSTTNLIGGNVKNNNGVITASNIGNTGKDTIHDAIASISQTANAAKTEVEAGDNMIVTSSTNADGSTNYQVSTAKDVTFDSVTSGSVTTDKLQVGQVTIDKNGINAGGQIVSNVSDGAINSTSKEAINGSQVFDNNSVIYNHFGGGADYATGTGPTYHVNGGTHNNVGDALGALNQRDNELQQNINNLGNQLEQSFISTNNRIDSLEKKASAGIAAAMALESAPFVAGKWTYAASTAYYGGENAAGVTLRNTSENGRWSLTTGIAAASTGNPSFRIGVTGVIN